jgi:hypothetical protein
VDDAVLVGVVEGAGGLAGDLDGVVHRELPLSPEALTERLALHERHGEPELAGGLARVVDGEDVGMLEPGREADLALEPVGTERSGELGQEHLERYRPVVLDVVGEKDRGHPAAPQLTLEDVAIAKGSSQPGGEIGQWG